MKDKNKKAKDMDGKKNKEKKERNVYWKKICQVVDSGQFLTCNKDGWGVIQATLMKSNIRSSNMKRNNKCEKEQHEGVVNPNVLTLC